jgi:hypothetical protein
MSPDRFVIRSTKSDVVQASERDSRERGASRSDDKQAPIRIGSIGKASFDVLLGEIGEVGQDFGVAHPGGKHSQDIIHRDSQTTNAGFSASFAWFNRDD